MLMEVRILIDNKLLTLITFFKIDMDGDPYSDEQMNQEIKAQHFAFIRLMQKMDKKEKNLSPISTG